MEYTYVTATGTTVIEVDDEWGSVLLELDKIEYNNNQTEARRHASLDAFNRDGTLFPSKGDSPTESGVKEQDTVLNMAIEKLKPKQRNLIRAVYFDGVSVSDFAKREYVSQPAISQRLATALKSLKKFM